VEAPRWSVTAGAVSVDANFENPELDLPAGVALASDESDTGFALGVRYRFTRRLEAELGYVDGGDSTFDLQAQVLQQSLRVRSRVGLEAVTAGLGIHLTPGRRAEVYAGPLLALLLVGDIEPTLDLRVDPSALPLPVPLPVLLGLLPELPIDPAALLDGPLDLSLRLPGVDVDDELAVGATVGVDVALGDGDRWLLNAAVRYLDSSLEGPLGVELDLEPLLLGAGISYRF